MKHSLLVALALLGTSTLPAAASQINLVNNGGFESYYAGWTITGNSVFSGLISANASVGNNVGPSTHGGDWAYIFGTYDEFGVPSNSPPTHTLGYLSQTLATEAGKSYDLEFYMQVAGLLGQPHKGQFEVQVGGATLLNEATSEHGYTKYSFNFVATGDETTLQFGAFSIPEYIYLDDISVTETTAIKGPTKANDVPEPATLTLMGSALAGLGVLRRRRQPK